MRYCFAILLTLIFAFQVVPVRQICRLLGNMQSIERVQGDELTDDSQDGACFAVVDLLLTGNTLNYTATYECLGAKTAIHIRETQALPVVSVAQIPSPPPEC